MGFLDFILGRGAGSTVEVLNDRIGMSQKAKLAAVRKELRERADSGSAAVLLVAHFPDTLERLNPIAADFQSRVPVKAVLTRNLSADIAASLHLDESATIDLIVAERHPLLSVDEKLTRFAEGLPCRARVVHHLAFDDPLFKLYAWEWMESVLERLGMTEDETIESGIISRHIKRVQQKIESQAFGNNRDASSAAQWLEKNVPNAK